MEVFEGYSVNQGMVLASVAKVRFDFGIPSLTSQRLRSLGERLQREEEGFVETEQVILVAESFPTSLVGSMIPGIEIVGVAVGEYVAEAELEAIERLLGPGQGRSKGEATSFPIVAGLGVQFVRETLEYEIVLVDGNAGRVFVAPDAFIVSQFQSTSTRKRYFMEGTHVPAKTASDNRVISVYTRADSPADINAGMRAGADGVYLTPNNEMLSAESSLSSSEQLQVLHEAMDLAGGQRVILDVPFEALAYSALLEAAGGGPIAIAVDDTAALTACVEAFDGARLWAPPDGRLGEPEILLAPHAPGDVSDLPEALESVGGIILRDPWNAYEIEYLFHILGLARRAGRPVIAILTENWRDEVEETIGFGVNGVVVPAMDAADVKDAIREL